MIGQSVQSCSVDLLKVQVSVGALVMGFSYLMYAVIGDYALYPDNNPDLPAVRS